MTKTIRTEPPTPANPANAANEQPLAHPDGTVRGRLVRRVPRGYAHGHERPLAGYAVVRGGYSAMVALLTGIGRVTATRLPERVGVQDTVLPCLGTHKASRLLAEDAVSSPLRAPFARTAIAASDTIQLACDGATQRLG